MSNGHLPNQWYEGEEVEVANNVNDEKQTVLYLKRNGDGQAGIETILKRELQGKKWFLNKSFCDLVILNELFAMDISIF